MRTNPNRRVFFHIFSLRGGHSKRSEAVETGPWRRLVVGRIAGWLGLARHSVLAKTGLARRSILADADNRLVAQYHIR